MPLNLFNADLSKCAGCGNVIPTQLKAIEYYYITKYFTALEHEKSEDLTKEWVRIQQVYPALRVVLPQLRALKAQYLPNNVFGEYQEFSAGVYLRIIPAKLEDDFSLVFNQRQFGVWHKDCLCHHINQQAIQDPMMTLAETILFFGVTIPKDKIMPAPGFAAVSPTRAKNLCVFTLCNRLVSTRFTVKEYDSVVINKEAGWLASILSSFKLSELISLFAPPGAIEKPLYSDVYRKKPIIKQVAVPQELEPNNIGVYYCEGAHFTLEILRHHLAQQSLALYPHDIIVAKNNNSEPVYFHSEHFFTKDGVVIPRPFTGDIFSTAQYNEVVRIMAN